MLPIGERVRKPFETFLSTAADLAAARAAKADDREASAAARRARAALGTGEARELLEEAVSAGEVDPVAHAALLAHLADVAEAEVLARRELTLDRSADERLVVNGRERRAGELVQDLRHHGRPDERAGLAALEAHFVNDREARREALAEAEERGVRILARAPRGPDEAPDDARERCERFLAETQDAAGELSARARHPLGNEARGLLGLLRALSPAELDPLFAPKGRARRLGAVIASLGLAAELSRSVHVRASHLLALPPRLVQHGAHVTIFPGAIELGLASERAFLSALGQAITRALVSRATPLEHRYAPLGSAAATFGAIFADAMTEPAFDRALYGAGARAERILRTAAACTTILEARLLCARALVTDRTHRGDAEARDRAAAALGCDPGEVSIEVALPLRQSRRRELRDARARLAALALVPALRERYDADFHRNPRFAELVRGAAARGGLVTAESLVGDTGGALDHAVRRVHELAG